jgi:hypothetical protein
MFFNGNFQKIALQKIVLFKMLYKSTSYVAYLDISDGHSTALVLS